MHELHLRVLASELTLVALSPATLAHLARDWSRCLVAPVEPRRRLDVHTEGADLTDGLAAPLTSRLTAVGVDDVSGAYVVLHACGLAGDDGRTLALVAPSGTGKSTAAALLSREQFGYVTDECLAVAPSGRVLPYPKPLALGLAAGVGEVQVGPDELGLRPCPPDLSLAAVVLLDRREDGDEASLERVGLAEALLALVPQTSALTDLDRPLVRLCEVLDRAGGTARLRYVDIERAADELLRLVSLDRAPDPWHPLDPGDADDPCWALRDGRVRRRPVRDAVAVSDEVVLLVGDRPVRLSPVGATIWRACERPATLTELTAAVVAAHGGHDEAQARVAEAVSALVAVRVLGCSPPLPPHRLLREAED